jgi:hypothetical protein
MKHGRKPWFVAGILLVAFSLFAAACGDDTTTTTAAVSTTGANAPRSLTIALAEEPRTLASWNAYSNDGHPVLRNVTEALLNRDPVTNELVPELATSYEQVDDNTWRFHLRQGVTFHDGSPFNAELRYSLNYIPDVDNAFPMLQFFGGIVVTATAVDELTSMSQPTSRIPSSRCGSISRLSRRRSSCRRTLQRTRHPIGTGPYKFDEWNRGQYIDISANADWWGLRDTADAYGNQLVSTCGSCSAPRPSAAECWRPVKRTLHASSRRSSATRPQLRVDADGGNHHRPHRHAEPRPCRRAGSRGDRPSDRQGSHHE